MLARQRVALYGRVSVDRGSTSVDDQLAALRRWADENDREVVATLRDDGISASRYARGKARPGWQRAMDLINGDKLDELAVWELSRTSRLGTSQDELIEACIAHGVKIVIDGRTRDPADPDDLYDLNVSNAASVRESGVMSKRVRRASDSRALAGRPHGRIAYGYAQAVIDGKLRRVLDPDRAAVVADLARRLIDGASAYDLARELNERGVPAPTDRPWTGSGIAALIVRPALAGLRVHRGEVLTEVTTTWPAIISREDHYKLVARFDDSSRRPTRTGETVHHLLVGVAQCGVCGSKVRALTRVRPNGRRVVNYDCIRFHVSRAAKPVDELVEARVLAFLTRPDSKAELTAPDPGSKAAAERLAFLRAELVKARKMHRAGKLTLDSLAGIEAWAVPELKQLERDSRPRQVSPVVLDAVGPDAATRWARTPTAARRLIIAALYTVTLMPVEGRGPGFDSSKIAIVRR